MNGCPEHPGPEDGRPSRPSFPGGRLLPGLRIGTHNICGFQGKSSHEHFPLPFSHTKLESLYRIWWTEYCLDIVLVQEHMVPLSATHAQASLQHQLDLISTRLHGPSYLILFACNPHASGGVAILVRRNLLDAGLLSIIGGEKSVIRALDGRLMHMHISWSGHSLHLINTYLQSGDSSAQREFIRQRLMPLDHRGHEVILGGDLNFTMNWQLDRFLPPSTTYHPDSATSSLMSDFLTQHDMAKTSLLRHFHPTQKTFSRFDSQGSRSLIDGFFASSSLLPHFSQCHVQNLTLSDHRPVILSLRPRSNVDIGPGLNRTSLSFWNSPGLKADFCDNFSQLIATAPEDDDALLDWWPSFKEQTLSLCRRFDKEQWFLDSSLSQEEGMAKSRLDAALLSLEEEENASDCAERLRVVIHARKTLNEVLASSSRTAHLRDKFQFISTGETPSRFLSKILSPPQSARVIAGFTPAPGMGLVTNGPDMAELMITHFATISASPAPHPQQSESEELVLNAVRLHAKRIDPTLAKQAGRPTIDEAEVVAALSNSEDVKAPGLDGLPPKLWKHGSPLLAPLLSRLFTTIGKTGNKPCRFNLGLISPIHKEDNRALTGNYRPICLLGTDYRILSKILAARLETLLSLVIGPEQMAFLKSRLIGDNITLFDLLPEALRSNAKAGMGCTAAWIFFADFSKAYDTCRRLFLKKIMETVGAGPDLLRWVDILLSDTFNACMVNGHISLLRLFEEGVRQGCPLACALYLFIAWGLQCWLLECPELGIVPVPSMHRICSVHFADDSKVLFLHLASLPIILKHFQVFGIASGQYLNPRKSSLLAMGDVHRLQGYSPTLLSSHGIKVVSSEKSLGVIHQNFHPLDTDRSVLRDWENVTNNVASAFERIAKAGLSIFGRASAASSYGISKALYKAEHSGIPSSVLSHLQELTSGLVDKGKLPPFLKADTGVPPSLLNGQAKTGGFGMLAWKENILGRHARAARRFLSLLLHPDVDQPLWVPLASTILSRLHPHIHPAFSFTSAPLLSSLPRGPLRRWASGLAALGPLQDIDSAPLQPGPWCKDIPLYRNPLFSLPGPPCPLVFTLGQLTTLLFFVLVKLASSPRISQAWLATFPLLKYLLTLCSSIPQPWILASCSTLSSPPSPNPVNTSVALIFDRLGWPGVPLMCEMSQPNGPALAPLSVRSATALLTRPALAAQAVARSTFIARANANSQHPSSLQNPKADLFSRVWKLRWLNDHKEPIWRLSLNGIPGRHLLHSCPCGGHHPPSIHQAERSLAWRDHHYWLCPLAQTIVSSISQALPNTHNINLECHHIWLLSPPHHSIHQGVWSVVATAAIAAMDSARRYMIKCHLEDVDQPQAQSLITDFFHSSQPSLPTPVRLSPLSRASRFATFRLWALVRDYADLNPLVPSSWVADKLKLHGHPILSSIDGTSLVFEPP